MVELNSDQLRSAYLNLIAVKRSMGYMQSQIQQRDDKFLAAIGFPFIGALPKKGKKEALAKVSDEMIRNVDDLLVLGIVAEYEKIVFKRLDNAKGGIVSVIEKHYDNEPFFDFKTDFVRTDIDRLSIIRKIVTPKLNSILANDFKAVIDHRNWVAHGKRSGVGEKSVLTFDDISATLDETLTYV